MANFQLMPQVDFLSFDGGVRARGALVRPSQNALRDFSEIEEKVLSGKRHRIVRGAGLSFAAPHFGDGIVTIDQSGFEQILGFDEDSGLVEVESGASMAQLYNFLAARNRYLVTQPTYPAITVGGCIAADAHGVNPYKDGTFRSQVSSLKLFHPSRGIVSASTEINREILDLTCGGLGLTGQIVSAKLKTRPLQSLRANLSVVAIDDLAELPGLLAQAAADNDSVASWHDFSAQGDAFGQGFMLIGRFGQGGGFKPIAQRYGLNASSRKFLDLSFYSLPFNRLVNVLYGGLHRFSRESSEVALEQFLYPAATAREYYYKLFGRFGFHESQLLVPADRFVQFITAVRQWLQNNELAVTLASARIFNGEQSLLRFDGKAVCFTINFPRCAAGSKFISFLDILSLDLGLIPYLVKDSRLPLKLVASVYPQYMLFRQKLRAFDKDRLYRSELSQRLEL